MWMMQRLSRLRWTGSERKEYAACWIASGCLVELRRHAPGATTLRSVEIEHIRATLKSTNWRIRGRGGAAERLGLKPTTLETRMAKLGLIRPRES